MTAAGKTSNRVNFTKASLDALVPQSKWIYYYDTKVSGLVIGVGPSGTKTFVLYRKVKRKPERIRIGRYPDMTVDQARNRAQELNGKIAIGEDPAAARRQRLAEMTFGDLFQTYLERHAKPFKKTAHEDVAKFKRHLSKQPRGMDKVGIDIACMPLSEIDGAILAQLYAVIAKATPVTANRVLSLVSGVFGRAIAWGLWQAENPCRGMKRHKEFSRERFLRPEEIAPFFDVVRAWPDGTTRDYILMSLFTGARRANVLAMRWSEIDLRTTTWSLPITKSGAPQSIPLVPQAVEILRARKDSTESDFVFPGRGKTGHLTDAKKAWKTILEKSGITELRLHDLRRTLGSWQAGTGASTAIIGKSLNHRSTTTTAVYARLWDQPVRDSLSTAVTSMLEYENQATRKNAKYNEYLGAYPVLEPEKTRLAYSQNFWMVNLIAAPENCASNQCNSNYLLNALDMNKYRPRNIRLTNLPIRK